jgi:hypothetical protein
VPRMTGDMGPRDREPTVGIQLLVGRSPRTSRADPRRFRRSRPGRGRTTNSVILFCRRTRPDPARPPAASAARPGPAASTAPCRRGLVGPVDDRPVTVLIVVRGRETRLRTPGTTSRPR